VLILYAWAALFAGTVVGLSIVTVHLAVLIWTTLAAVLALALLSIPKLRWWERHRQEPMPDIAGQAGDVRDEHETAVRAKVGVARGAGIPRASDVPDEAGRPGEPIGRGSGHIIP
jgi:hypothetical protein